MEWWEQAHAWPNGVVRFPGSAVAECSRSQDKQRFRWFKANYGFMRAKQHAEDVLASVYRWMPWTD